jgi:hypothetical protein
MLLFKRKLLQKRATGPSAFDTALATPGDLTTLPPPNPALPEF